MTGTYVLAPASCSSGRFIVVFDTTTSTFLMKQYSLGLLSDVKLEPISGR